MNLGEEAICCLFNPQLASRSTLCMSGSYWASAVKRKAVSTESADREGVKRG